MRVKNKVSTFSLFLYDFSRESFLSTTARKFRDFHVLPPPLQGPMDSPFFFGTIDLFLRIFPFGVEFREDQKLKKID